ncbi:MAG: DUF4168 domain-containing protein [Gemmatimonadota bacterium]
MRVVTVVAALSMAVGLGLVSATDVAAQEMPQEQEAPDVSDEELERFVEVYPEVVEISRAAQTELGQTSDPEDAQAIQEEANAEIEEELEDVGMDFEEYDGIVRALNTDPELLQRFEELMEEVHGENPLGGGGGGGG